MEAGFGCLAGHSPLVTFNYVGGEIVELKVEVRHSPVRWVGNGKWQANGGRSYKKWQSNAPD